MAIQSTTNRQYTAPAAADSVSITPSGSVWTNSAWVELLAATPAAAVLTGVIAGTRQPSTVHFEVDIGVGTAGAEVVIATVKGISYQLSATIIGAPLVFAFPLPIDAIASSARIAARVRTSSTNTTAFRVAVTYLLKPIGGGTVLTTSTQTRALPSGAALLNLTAGSGWSSGAWVQLHASMPADSVVVGIIADGQDATQSWEVDIGVGGSGSESVITTVRGHTAGIAGQPWLIPFPNPLSGIASGDRVVMRARNDGVATITVAAGLLYHEQPL